MKHCGRKNRFIYHSSLEVFAAVPLDPDLINNIVMLGGVIVFFSLWWVGCKLTHFKLSGF